MLSRTNFVGTWKPSQNDLSRGKIPGLAFEVYYRRYTGIKYKNAALARGFSYEMNHC